MGTQKNGTKSRGICCVTDIGICGLVGSVGISESVVGDGLPSIKFDTLKPTFRRIFGLTMSLHHLHASVNSRGA